MYEEMNRFAEGLSRRGFLSGAVTGAAAFAVAGAGAFCLNNVDVSAAHAEGATTLETGAVKKCSPTKAARLEPYASPAVILESEQDQYAKKVLVVVDYQVDFVDGGVFGRIEPAMAIEDALCEVIGRYQKNGDVVIYTMDTHPPDNYDRTREGNFNPPHCIPGTEGWEVYGKARELLTPERAIRVKKGTYGSRDLPQILQAIMGQGVVIESVEFAGVSTTCRVLHNAIILYNFFPELPMIFDECTTASYTDEATASQLEELEGWGFIVKRRNASLS